MPHTHTTVLVTAVILRIETAKGLANSARIGPDTGGGWTAVLTNLQNALPVSGDAGPTANGGYWNDGSLQLTPGFGCHHGDSITDPAPSDSCMTETRFVSMYSIWTIMAFNLLLVGDFAKLNQLVMTTWTNENMIAIDQDIAGIAAIRIDGAKNQTPVRASTGAQMYVAECGGEPANQKWTMNSSGFIANAATGECLDVNSCQTWISYSACNATQSCGGATHNNERWLLTSSGQLQTALATQTK
jgi:hypothetical protein|eukprot:COSAG01_NODE_5401_length_4294_cov_154.339226_5_plen_244_part_00